MAANKIRNDDDRRALKAGEISTGKTDMRHCAKCQDVTPHVELREKQPKGEPSRKSWKCQVCGAKTVDSPLH